MKKKELQELIKKDGSFIGAKTLPSNFNVNYMTSKSTTDDVVDDSRQKLQFQTPYRRYFGEEDISNHPLFSTAKNSKTKSQFAEKTKKKFKKMSDDEINDAAKLFGFKDDTPKTDKDKKKVTLKEKGKQQLTEDEPEPELNEGINIRGLVEDILGKQKRRSGMVERNKEYSVGKSELENFMSNINYEKTYTSGDIEKLCNQFRQLFS